MFGAVNELVDDYDLDRARLPNLTELPNGEPFNFADFVDKQRFPQEGPPTFEQMVTDKLWVVQVAGERLLMLGAPESQGPS